MFDDESPDDLDADIDDDETFFDIEDEGPVIDVHAIVRVCYTRGLINKLSDLRSGRGVLITEWEAPQIPQTVLESLEREAVDTLAGEWGDPRFGDPIQVDIIDLETDDEVVSIQVFNRGICLIHADSEELRRIHRVCGALDAAAGGARAADVADDTAAATVESKTPWPPVEVVEVDMSAVLKEHRRQGGTCALCGTGLTRGGTRKHLASCAPAHDAASGQEQELAQIRVTAPGLPAYWLDLEVRMDAKLDALDAFLREIWLECCGHLSAFDTGAVKYFSRGYDFAFKRTFGGFGALGRRRVDERSMKASVASALPSTGEPIEYEYDFGSTTRLQLKVVGERTGRPARASVRLLVRNTAPVWPCAICGQPATVVCTYCLAEDDGAFACPSHSRRHTCGETEAFMPVVNSPRMGVCGYATVT